MSVKFMAVKRFDSSCGEKWESFINWSKLYHILEVVTLDCSLCPSLFIDLISEDWTYIDPDVIFPDMFSSLDWVQGRTEDSLDKVILAVLHKPDRESKDIFNDDRFHFCGYDLLEDDTRISALVNCGGFDKAFSPYELNSHGLITDFQRATAINDKLRIHYPQEHHAQCTLWAMWKMVKF